MSEQETEPVACPLCDGGVMPEGQPCGVCEGGTVTNNERDQTIDRHLREAVEAIERARIPIGIPREKVEALREATERLLMHEMGKFDAAEEQDRREARAALDALEEK